MKNLIIFLEKCNQQVFSLVLYIREIKKGVTAWRNRNPESQEP